MVLNNVNIAKHLNGFISEFKTLLQQVHIRNSRVIELQSASGLTTFRVKHQLSIDNKTLSLQSELINF